MNVSTKDPGIDTIGVAAFTDLVDDFLGLLLIFEGALGTIDELLDGLLVDISPHLLHDADGEGCDLLVDQVPVPADQLQDADDFLPRKLLHGLLAEHVLDEQSAEDWIRREVRIATVPTPIRAAFLISMIYNYDKTTTLSK